MRHLLKSLLHSSWGLLFLLSGILALIAIGDTVGWSNFAPYVVVLMLFLCLLLYLVSGCGGHRGTHRGQRDRRAPSQIPPEYHS